MGSVKDQLFLQCGNMLAELEWHTASVLKDGNVLVVGGWDGEALNTAELYNPHGIKNQ